MKTIITGTRRTSDHRFTYDFIKSSPFHAQITEVFSLGDSGIDQYGRMWAMENRKPIRYFRANWTMYPKVAGIIAIREMATFADAAIVIDDGTYYLVDHFMTYSRGLDPKLHIHYHRLPSPTTVTQGRQESTTGDLETLPVVQPVTVASHSLVQTGQSLQPVCTNPVSVQAGGLPIAGLGLDVTVVRPVPSGGC